MSTHRDNTRVVDEYESIGPEHALWPEGSCPRCSMLGVEDGELVGTSTTHGFGTRCERDPALPVNVITAHFKQRCPEYVGIVWEAIANNAVRALVEAGYEIVEPA